MAFIYYTLGTIIGGLALIGMIEGGVWCFAFPLFTFGFIPISELIIAPDPTNLDDKELKNRKEFQGFQSLLYAVLPLQFTLLYFYLEGVSSGSLSGWSWVGATLSMGVACAAYGINVAHELGHRVSPSAKWTSKALLLSTLYMHFFIEHNRGHHKNVATGEDPASARRGETVYAFWLRSVIGSIVSAWRLEATRLSRKNQRPFSLKNQMVRFLMIEIAFILGILWMWGGLALASFLLSASLGFLLLETVNYIEHYGLSRALKPNGKYEAVQPIHSWNSNHPFGRIVLFELSRHSDHHAHPRRPYSTLRHHEHSLQFPTGYPGMILFSLIPPLFIPFMEVYIEREYSRLGLTTSSPG